MRSLVIVIAIIALFSYTKVALAHEVVEKGNPSKAILDTSGTMMGDVANSPFILKLSTATLLVGGILSGAAVALKARRSQLIFWGALASSIGGTFLAVVGLLTIALAFSLTEQIASSILYRELFVILMTPVSSILLGVAALGLYALFDTKSKLCLTGLIFVFCATMASLMLAVYETYLVSGSSSPDGYNVVANLSMITAVVYAVGILLISLAAYKRSILGKWRALPLLVALLATPLPPLAASLFAPESWTLMTAIVAKIAVGLGWTAIGALMLDRAHTPSNRPSLSSADGS